MSDLRKAAQQALEALETCDAAHPSDGGAQWYDVNAVDAAISALHTTLAQPDVPEGFVLVPVEPTPEMLAVAMKRGGHYGYDYEIKAEWRAMLAAAQKGGA